jgi:phosphoribosylanthranilate isomerase
VRVTVKICGLTSRDDAASAIAAGADFLGFVFFPSSRRCLPPDACTWVREVGGPPRVGVFRDQSSSFVGRIRDEARLDLVQLHGEEPVELCAHLGGRARVIKAIAVDETIDWGRVAAYAEVARILFDTASPSGGGTGRAFNWRLLRAAPPGFEFWLAGGLTPDSVAAAIAQVRPAGVDVASGVEAAPGHKDPARMLDFVAAVRSTAGDARAGGRGDSETR